MTLDEFSRIVDDFGDKGDDCWWHFEVKWDPGHLSARLLD
jgi:hypothetical protein